MFLEKEIKIIDKKLRKFIFSFSEETFDFKYRKQILICANLGKTIFPVFLDDLFKFDKRLFNLLIQKPFFCLNIFEFTINRLIAKFLLRSFSKNKLSRNFQICLIWKEKPSQLRGVSTSQLTRIINLKVKILSVGPIRLRKNNFAFFSDQERIKKSGFPGKQTNEKLYLKNLPEFKNSNDEEVFIFQKNFIGFQVLKAKEIPETSLCENQEGFPIWLILEGELINLISPGDQVTITGVFLNFQNSAEKNFQKGGTPRELIFQVLGFFFYRKDRFYHFSSKTQFFYQNFLNFAKTRKVYDWIYSCISPDLLGFEKIKKGLACLLFGGTSKKAFCKHFNPGLLNILIVGDDLKLKRIIFNFLKSLSTQDHPRITLENLFKSNSGLVEKAGISYELMENELVTGIGDLRILCLENLQSLKINERIGIYSLLEKPFFSVKKNDFQGSSENISLLAFISGNISKRNLYNPLWNIPALNSLDYSKFNLIFFVPEKSSEENDKIYINQIFSSFQKTKSEMNSKNKKIKKFNLEMFKNYIAFSRYKFNPQISIKASLLLQNAYLFIRISERKSLWFFEENFSIISIKVLESMIKISESICRMRMSNMVDSKDALEAIKITKDGIINLY